MGEIITEEYKTVDLAKIHAQRLRSASGAMAHIGPNWYQQLMVNTGTLKARLQRYEMMDESVDISRALDIMAEDISSTDGSDDKIFLLKHENDEKFKSSQYKALNAALNRWKRKTKFDLNFFEYVRDVLKNGIVIFRKKKDGSLVALKPERIEGYMVSEDDPDVITHYLYNPKTHFTNKNKDTVFAADRKANYEPLPVEELVIMKLGEAAYGQSQLDKVYRAWRQLTLLEDAVIIYRIVRAPERRIFSIDVGDMPPKKAEAYIESVKNKMHQTQVIQNGKINSNYNPASMQEDIYLATSGEGRGSRVETLPGGDNLGRIEDLMYFNKKLATALRIPPSYLDIYSADMEGGHANDGRIGTAYMAELRYIGYIRRLQKQLVAPLFEHFKEFAKSIGVKVPEGIYLEISPPQSFAVYKENEINSALLNVYGSADSIQSLSKREALRKFAGFTEEQIVRNEQAKLMELGYSESAIKKMELHEIYNKVYNEGIKLEEDEDAFGGGFGSSNGGLDPTSYDSQATVPEESPPSGQNEKKEIGKGGGFASRSPNTPSNIYKTREELNLADGEKHPADRTKD